VLCSVLIKALGLQPAHPELFYLFTIVLAMLSIAIFQFLVYLFGIAGDFIGVVVLMLQLTSSGGSYPKETLPQFFQTIGPYLPMTYAVSAFRDIISGNQINVSGVFSLYGTAILTIVGLTALFKWILSRDPVIIKQPYQALEKVSGRLTLRRNHAITHLKISTLKLSREFSQSARHEVKKMRAARLVLRQQAGERVVARRTALAQKVSKWKRPQNRSD
jgi:hypothetical protein